MTAAESDLVSDIASVAAATQNRQEQRRWCWSSAHCSASAWP
jgi:hypothetical protein